jgi:hypothetical protein
MTLKRSKWAKIRATHDTMSGRVPDEWQEYIRLGIDYGTGYLKLAVQYIYPGRNESSQDTHDVYLEDLNDIAQEVAIKQVAIRTEDQGLIWGKRPVQRWIQDHPEDRDSVLSAWKLALMANFKDREIVQQTIKALGSPDQRSHEGELQELITEHLRQIKARTLEWCQEKSPVNYFLRPDWGILPWVSRIPKLQHGFVSDSMLTSIPWLTRKSKLLFPQCGTMELEV